MDFGIEYPFKLKNLELLTIINHKYDKEMYTFSQKNDDVCFTLSKFHITNKEINS